MHQLLHWLCPPLLCSPPSTAGIIERTRAKLRTRLDAEPRACRSLPASTSSMAAKYFCLVDLAWLCHARQMQCPTSPTQRQLQYIQPQARLFLSLLCLGVPGLNAHVRHAGIVVFNLYRLCSRRARNMAVHMRHVQTFGVSVVGGEWPYSALQVPHREGALQAFYTNNALPCHGDAQHTCLRMLSTLTKICLSVTAGNETPFAPGDNAPAIRAVICTVPHSQSLQFQ